ncbi:MAG: two-component system sensor protein [Gammaproteobacteria bacterium]|jgi:signal transduction histidine kinase/ligand-binding sensor domain-containing protein|nr:two-component system sensor protein [Gammaproteobacteria bacterium]
MRSPRALCVLFSLIGCADAATPSLDITEYFRTSLSLRQEAPTVVNALAQTSDGFLWLGTPSGLYRFDGVRLDRIGSVGGVRLLGEGITALAAPPSGGLWIGYQYGGVSLLNDDAINNYPLESGLPRGTVKSLAVDTDGVVWAATSRGLARFDRQHWEDMTERLGLPSPYIEQVLADKTGALWINSGDKLALLPRGSSRVHVYAIPADNWFHADAAGRVWTMRKTPACLYLLDATRDADPTCRPLPAGTFALWLVDRRGNLWISDTSDHMRVVPIPDESKAAAPEPQAQSLANRPFIVFSGGEPHSALQDREGNIWFGTALGLDQMRVSRLRRHGPFAKNVVLAAGNHNSLWVATTHFERPRGEDFFRLDDGRMVPYAGGPTGVTASYREPTGTLWVGGSGRLWKLENRKWEEVGAPPELSQVTSETRIRTQSIARDASGAVWLSVVRVGLFKLQSSRWERVVVPGTSESEYPAVIYADAKGPVWFGYPHARLASLTQGTWRLYTEKDGITVGSVQALSNVNGEIWLGGDQGLGRIREGRFESFPSLDALGSVTGLLQAKSGDLWLSTSIGAVYIERQELARFSDNPGKTPRYETFDFADGMPGVAPAIRPLPTALQTDDGRIWFEANNSFASIDPTERIKNAVAPTVLICSIADDGRRRAPQASLLLFPKVHNLAIDYTATSLSIPSRVRFKYRLEGFDPDWREAGEQRTAYYNNLPPGRYAFRVIAANDDGIWNRRGAVVFLIVPPLFYQTLSFRVVGVVAVVLVVAALFFGRLRQVTERERRRLEQRVEDRLNERTRIARELHDSLLQGFQGLMFRLQAVRQLLPKRPDEAARFLEVALEVGDQAIGEGRNAVQNLRSPIFDDRDLVSSLVALGAELCIGVEPQAKSEYRVVVEGRPRELRPSVRDDAYRIVREAVRNACQHAHARHIETEVTFGDADLSIRVRDDGIGVDPQILARGQRAGHWGLPGMRERSETLGGRLNVWSERNAGTEVELRIAADIAYPQPLTAAASRIRNFFSFSR